MFSIIHSIFKITEDTNILDIYGSTKPQPTVSTNIDEEITQHAWLNLLLTNYQFGWTMQEKILSSTPLKITTKEHSIQGASDHGIIHVDTLVEK